MGAKNKVIAGEYEGKPVMSNAKDSLIIVFGFTKTVIVNKDTVESYEIMDSDSKTSASSAIARGLIGSFALGPVGLLAGLSAKKKGIYTVAIQFKDGKKSLLELDEKLHKFLITKLF